MEKHDFKRFPELTNRQMEIHYFESPHKQITEPFTAKVTSVHDGDTIRLKWGERDFDFPLRMANLAAPELNEDGGKASQRFMESRIMGKEVEIILTPQRVEKWGRLLGYVIEGGESMSEASIREGHGISWEERGNIAFPEIKLDIEELF